LTDTAKLNFDNTHPKECHRIIANYFKNLIPETKEYYLHHFTIQKERNKGNYYGLIFGTNHTFGMEKFLKVCWQLDRTSGESNCNIDNDWDQNSLFFEKNTSNKKQEVTIQLKNLILSGEIKDNISGFKFVLKSGCLPGLFTDIINELEAQKKIERIGNVNNTSTIIHKAKQYQIKVC
jgi:hypothetical protein